MNRIFLSTLFLAFMLSGCTSTSSRQSSQGSLDTLLLQAAKNGDSDTVSQLLSAGANPNARNIKNFSALNHAAYNGNADIAEKLLKAGAKLDSDDTEFQSMELAASRGHAQVIRAFVAHGASIESFDKHGFRPLTTAAKEGHLDAVKELLDAGAGINNLTNGTTNATALMWAAYDGRTDVVNYLMDHGADPYYRDEGGVDALKLCVSRKKDDTCNALRQKIGERLRKEIKHPLRLWFEQDGKKIEVQNNRVRLAKRPFTMVYDYKKDLNLVMHASHTGCFATDQNDFIKLQSTFGWQGPAIAEQDHVGNEMFLRGCNPLEYHVLFYLDSGRSRFHSVRVTGQRIVARRRFSGFSPGGDVAEMTQPVFLTILETKNTDRWQQAVISMKPIRLDFSK